MGYIAPPEPGDDEIIFTTKSGEEYTWGEHRAMEKMLGDLESSDTTVRAARDKLDQTLMRYGFDIDPTKRTILICEHCGKQEGITHEEDCPDYDRSLPYTRDAGGYQYLSDKFVVVHTTSVPMDDEEALDYFRIVQAMFPSNDGEFWVRYIMRREMHSNEYEMMPWQYNKDVGEVFPIEQPGS